jgi:hypothetical protein
MTIVAAMVAWFFIVDFPQKAKFLSEDERAHAIERLNKDRGDGDHDQITSQKIVKHLSDWKLWVFALIVRVCHAKLICSFVEAQFPPTHWRILLRILCLVSC